MSSKVEYYVVQKDQYINDVIANESPDCTVYLLESNLSAIGDFLLSAIIDLDPEFSDEHHWLSYGGEVVESSLDEVQNLLVGFSEEFYQNLIDYILEVYGPGHAEDILVGMIRDTLEMLKA